MIIRNFSNNLMIYRPKRPFRIFKYLNVFKKRKRRKLEEVNLNLNVTCIAHILRMIYGGEKRQTQISGREMARKKNTRR